MERTDDGGAGPTELRKLYSSLLLEDHNLDPERWLWALRHQLKAVSTMTEHEWDEPNFLRLAIDQGATVTITLEPEFFDGNFLVTGVSSLIKVALKEPA